MSRSETQNLTLLNRLKKTAPKLVCLDQEADEQVDICSKKIVSLLASSGIFKYLVPRTNGGEENNVSCLSLCVIRKFLATFSAVADGVFAVQGLGSYPIAIAGSSAVKNKYLPRAASGTSIFAFAVTEPEAGSDINGIKTKARRIKKGFSLTGVKSLISNATIADVFVVFARLDDQIRAFVCGRDVLSVKAQTLMAPHSIGEVFLENSFVPEENLLKGNGYKIATETIKLFRPTVGASACGMATRAFHESVSFAKTRKQFSRPLSSFQSIRFMLADMYTSLVASELLVFQAAQTGHYSSAAKLLATESASKIIDMALQIHGGRGLIKGSSIESLYRYSRAQRIYEGTSEIQRLIIAKEILEE